MSALSAWRLYTEGDRVDADIAARRKHPAPAGYMRESDTTDFALVWCPSPVQASGAVHDGWTRRDGWDYRAPVDRPWIATVHIGGRRIPETFHVTPEEAMAAIDAVLS